jgi:hypothetical protein
MFSLPVLQIREKLTRLVEPAGERAQLRLILCGAALSPVRPSRLEPTITEGFPERSGFLTLRAHRGGRRPAFTGLATQPYSATEVDGWQHKLSRVSQNRAAVPRSLRTGHLVDCISRIHKFLPAQRLRQFASFKR